MSAPGPDSAADGRVGVRAMTPADVPAVHALETLTAPRPWTAANLASCLAEGYAAWVVTVGDGIVAYAILALLHDEGHLLNIAVAPGHRGRGHARHLLALVRAHATAQGCHALLLEVRVSNAPARRLYESLGFALLGVRRRYYPNPDGSTEDAAVCALPLAPAAPDPAPAPATSPAATPPPGR